MGAFPSGSPRLVCSLAHSRDKLTCSIERKGIASSLVLVFPSKMFCSPQSHTRSRQFWDVGLLDMTHTAHPPRFPFSQFPSKCYIFPSLTRIRELWVVHLLDTTQNSIYLDSHFCNFVQNLVFSPTSPGFAK